MLSQQLQRLLLDTDCIAVPGLGCFVVHSMPARYLSEESLLLPPSRTISFHSIALREDTSLTQAYMVAMNATAKEAEKQLALDISTLKRSIQRTGEAVLEGVGVLSLTYNGRYHFEPSKKYSCQFLGLDSLVCPLQPIAVNLPITATDDTAQATPKFWKKTAITFVKESLKYAAFLVVALLSYFMVSYPIDLSNDSTGRLAASSPSLVFDQRSLTSSTLPTTNVAIPEKKDSTPTATTNTPTTAKIETLPTTGAYTIVLASAITEANAQALVKRLEAKGYQGVEILKRKTMIRVVLGAYDTKSEAQRIANELHQTTNTDVKSAWVMALPSKS